MSRRSIVIGSAVLGVVAVALVTALGVATARSGEVLAGVTVAGTDLGGLGPDDARERLAAIAAERSDEGVVFTHDGREFPVDPVEIGAAVDVDALVDQALGAGRDGSFFADRIAALRGTDVTLEIDVEVDHDALEARIAAIAAEVDTPLSPGDVAVDPVTLTVTTTDPTAGVTTRQDEATALVVDALDVPGPETLELPVEVVEPETDPADVEALAEKARDAIAEDLTLTSEDGELDLSPREVAALLSSEQVGTGANATLELVVTPAAVEEVLQPLADPLLRDARNASYDVPRRPPTSFDDMDDARWSKVAVTVDVVPGRTGTEVEPGLAAETLTDTVRRAERSVRLPLAEYPPEFSTEQAREQVPTHLLSTFTTYHACCAARVTNIQRLADLVDGTMVLPGEQFSINQISGVRECSKGFAPAGMILDGEIVDSCGGGVSQFGTTTVNAVFFAGFEPDAYKPHSFYISRYPMAREATLNYPSPDIDVRFTNTSGAPVVVRTSYTGTSITVSFYGRTDVTEVRADVGSRQNIKPFRTERRVNRDLPPGAEKVVQGGIDGFYVPLTRTVVREGGDVSTDDWSNAYVAATKIVEYNPEPAPEPSPSPKESPSPTETPSPSESPDADPSETAEG